ncbi:MAG: peptidase sortase [Parcubacteria group bacterium]|nr:peptidase sortase [Parcubacteria group bacterium]
MKKRTLAFIALTISGIVFMTVLIRATVIAPTEGEYVPILATASNGVTASSMPSIPTRLIIPSIEVDAKVQGVGLTLLGNMGVPHNYTDVGWYKYGTIPGAKGSAVIDGHVDDGVSIPAIFGRLKDMKPGDLIIIRTESGKELTFKTEEVQLYSNNEVPRTRLFNRADGIYLNLITCSGSWLPDRTSYDHRLVVYARLVT